MLNSNMCHTILRAYKISCPGLAPRLACPCREEPPLSLPKMGPQMVDLQLLIFS